jgi:flagellar hook assembly protein FlgD
VRLDLYNVTGQRVRTLVDAELPAGTHAVRWDGTDQQGQRAATGVYLYQLRAGAAKLTRKVVVIR